MCSRAQLTKSHPNSISISEANSELTERTYVDDILSMSSTYVLSVNLGSASEIHIWPSVFSPQRWLRQGWQITKKG